MSIEKYNNILKEHFGYEKLKSEQYDIIYKIVEENKDVCAILATGFGKSICFQMPYLITQKCVVIISPLIALMEDQMTHMENLDISACCLNSTCKDKKKVKEDILEGDYKLIYITPEYLQYCEEFLTELEEQDGICLVAIDESHCVSTYGNDFRPTYKELKVIREWIPNVPILAVTATASQKVREDIIKFLKLKDPYMVVGNFDRPNLYIEVNESASSSELNDKTKRLIKKNKDEYIILYCKTKNDTEKIAESISKLGIKCEAYHAGLTSKKRTEIQQKFIEGEIKCISATIAFGMGINISNVRLVIHLGCPKNMESYYQEIGRAGRDGEQSSCYLFFAKKDFMINRHFLKEIKNSTYRNYQEEQLRLIEKFIYSKECRRNLLLKNFGTIVTSCNNCDNCNSNQKIIKKDYTYYAYLLLSSIKNLYGNFGLLTHINVLRGSSAKNIKPSMKKTEFYNKGKDYSLQWWKTFSRELINMNLIVEKMLTGRNKFGTVISCTKNGLEWLNKLEKNYQNIINNKDTLSSIIKEQDKVYISSKIEDNEPKDDIEIALEIMKNDDNSLNNIKNENSNKKWTEKEEKKLLELIKNKKIKDISIEHKRTEGSIRSRLKLVACRLYQESKKTEKDIENICEKTKLSKNALMKVLENGKLYEKNKSNNNSDEEDEAILQMEKELKELEEMEEKSRKK